VVAVRRRSTTRIACGFAALWLGLKPLWLLSEGTAKTERRFPLRLRRGGCAKTERRFALRRCRTVAGVMALCLLFQGTAKSERRFACGFAPLLG
jgi:hypothetical protein